MSLKACSACAGDYEDPERTAGTRREVNESEEDGLLTTDGASDGDADGSEFPAEEAEEE